MNDFDPSDRDIHRAIRSWLREDRHEDASGIAAAVLDQIPSTPRRHAGWWTTRRIPDMHKIASIGLGAAAVIALLIVGPPLLGRPAPGGAGGTPSTAPDGAGLPEGPFLAVEATGGRPSVTVTIPAPGWGLVYRTADLVHDPASHISGDVSDSAFDVLGKGDAGATIPEAAILFLPYPADTPFVVYADPCDYYGPGTVATTADDFAAALAAQPSRDATEPVDVTVGGYAGKSVTLHVPADVEWRQDSASFGCGDARFVSYGASGPRPEPIRWHQGPGQIDELWVLDVDGSIVVIDAMYRPDTPIAIVEELRAIARSATFD